MDRHLNLFFSYNRDNELIENNLTRAFIVSLNMVGPGARDAILRALMVERLAALAMDCPSFSDAEFALQGNVSKERAGGFHSKILVTIATETLEELGQVDTALSASRSIPDAWIIAGNHCLLIEAKVGANPLSEPQVLAHAKGWLGLNGDQLAQRHVPLTWYAVQGVLERFLQDSQEASRPDDPELRILRSLTDFLTYFGYRHFDGFRFADLVAPPATTIHAQERISGFAFAMLAEPPSLQLAM